MLKMVRTRSNTTEKTVFSSDRSTKSKSKKTSASTNNETSECSEIKNGKSEIEHADYDFRNLLLFKPCCSKAKMFEVNRKCAFVKNNSDNSQKFDNMLVDLDSPHLGKAGSGIPLKPRKLFPLDYEPTITYDPEGYEDDLFESDADDEIWNEIKKCKSKKKKRMCNSIDPCSSNSKKENVKNEKRETNVEETGFPYVESSCINEVIQKQRMLDENAYKHQHSIHFPQVKDSIAVPETGSSETAAESSKTFSQHADSVEDNASRLKHNFKTSQEFQFFVLNVIPGMDLEDDEDEIRQRIEEDERIERQRLKQEAARIAALVRKSKEKRTIAKPVKRQIREVNSKQISSRNETTSKSKPIARKTSSVPSSRKRSIPKPVQKSCLKGAKVKISKRGYKKNNNAVATTITLKTEKRKVSVLKPDCNQPKQKKSRLSASLCRKMSKTSEQNYTQNNVTKLRKCGNRKAKLIKCKQGKAGEERKVGCTRKSKPSQSLIDLSHSQKSKVNKKKCDAFKISKLQQKSKKATASSAGQKHSQRLAEKCKVIKCKVTTVPDTKHGINPEVKKICRNSQALPSLQYPIQNVKARHSFKDSTGKFSLSKKKNPKAHAAMKLSRKSPTDIKRNHVKPESLKARHKQLKEFVTSLIKEKSNKVAPKVKKRSIKPESLKASCKQLKKSDKSVIKEKPIKVNEKQAMSINVSATSFSRSEKKNLRHSSDYMKKE